MHLVQAELIKAIARYAIAIPNVTQVKAAVMVIVAVRVRKAVITPINILAIMARMVQPSVHLNLKSDIVSPPDTIYAPTLNFANVF